MTERKLASIRKIDKIEPIANADAIEVATVGGWKVVVKRGEYSPGDMVVYFEIDSFIPTHIAPFLTKEGKEPKEYNGVKGERLKTVKLRGQISQGLIVPVPVNVNKPFEGKDLTEELGIQKWEPPASSEIGGQSRGNFPTHLVRKTDAERVQNMSKTIETWRQTGEGPLTHITEKLDGTSFTATTDGKEIFVCSRNISLKDDGNLYWKMAHENKIPTWLEKQAMKGKLYAIQGEIVGPGIQGNLYCLDKPTLFIFSIFDVKEQKYLDIFKVEDIANSKENRKHWLDALGESFKYVKRLKFRSAFRAFRQLDLKPEWNMVPRLGIGRIGWSKGYEDVENILKSAEGKSVLNKKAEREGLVFWGCTEPVKFKAISNKWLMKHD